MFLGAFGLPLVAAVNTVAPISQKRFGKSFPVGWVSATPASANETGRPPFLFDGGA
jgi:hypothetical protein